MIEAFGKWLPEGISSWIFEKDQSPMMTKVRENREYVHEVAAKLIEDKRRELEDGTSQRDIFSLLVKASSTLRPEWRLNDQEMIDQVRTIMLAGHEPVSKTMVFTLWELARKPQVQDRLRAEITETMEKVRARGDTDFDVNDFDSMPYLVAVVKEALRLLPPASDIPRVTTKDDILPLSKPIVGVSGKVYNEVPVPAGTLVFLSIIGYGLNKDIWGQDASEFRPERWLEANGTPEARVGVYGNLCGFSGGPMSCIAWRFALLEMHTVLTTLVKQFAFALPGNGKEIKRLNQIAVFPVVVGEEDKGPQLPLLITALGNE